MPEEISKQAPPLTSSLLIPAHPLLGREENMKLLFDDTMSDISHDRKTSLRISEARQLNDLRHARNAITIDHMLDVASLIAIQTGQTENQVEQGPEDTASGAEDTSNAGIAASDQAIATSLGNLLSALVPVVTATGGVVTSQSLAALLPVIVAAVGNATGTSSATGK
jgi:hypothetical protein